MERLQSWKEPGPARSCCGFSFVRLGWVQARATASVVCPGEAELQQEINGGYVGNGGSRRRGAEWGWVG